jgi:hypothetical protein
LGLAEAFMLLLIFNNLHNWYQAATATAPKYNFTLMFIGTGRVGGEAFYLKLPHQKSNHNHNTGI